MRRFITMLLAAVMLFCMTACGTDKVSETENVDGAESHTIGVAVYNVTDNEVVAFRDYLENYIAAVYPGISFLYSDTITDEADCLAFIENAAEEGVDGILSFISYDLAAEVELCEQNGIYYMMASGSVADKDFEAVASNPYFLGVAGPGTEMEYQAGADMAKYFAENEEGNQYFILSAGAFIGNPMHLERTKGMLDALQKAYGVSFDRSSEELAASPEITYVSAGELEVMIVPGFMNLEDFVTPAKEAYEEEQYGKVLAAAAAYDFVNVPTDAHFGMIDCYSEENLQLFTSGELCYLTGKYSSIIGPSFAAMYNAVTGYAEDFRENGKAFRLTQGFWTSSDYDDYVEKYAMSASVVMNAYNYEDLGAVCKVYNPDASLEDLKKLAGEYSFTDAMLRRTN